MVRMWPTPRASAAMANGKAGRPDSDSRLEDVVANYPTPMARDYRSGSVKHWERHQGTRNLNDYIALEKNGGQLNPTWVELLMGYPAGWTDISEED